MYQCNLLNWPFWGVPCGFSVSQLGTIQVNGIIILGSGLGRDSEYLPKGVVKMEYTVRLNNVGDFALPPGQGRCGPGRASRGTTRHCFKFEVVREIQDV